MTFSIRIEDAPFDCRVWLPDTPEHVVGGRLEVEDGMWTLTLLGWLGIWDHGERDRDMKPDLIHGTIGVEPVTLMDLVYRRWSGGSRRDVPHQAAISVNEVVAGLHVDPATLYGHVNVRLEHLNEWADRQPFSLADSGGDASSTIDYTHLDTLTAALPGGTASLYRTLSQSYGTTAASMESNECVQFALDEPIDLESILHDWVRPLVQLLELASASVCRVIELTVTPDVADDHPRSASVLTGTITEPADPTVHSFWMLFKREDVEFATVLPAWWDLHSNLGIVADLLSTLRETGGYVSFQFLAGATAIEGYHRHLFPTSGTRPTFASRLSEMVEHAGPLFPRVVGDVAAWSTWVKDGRNSVAHRAPEMIDLDREWRTTVRITPTLEWLLTLVALRDLDISDDVIARGVRRNRRMDGVSDLLRAAKPEWFEVAADC